MAEWKAEQEANLIAEQSSRKEQFENRLAQAEQQWREQEETRLAEMKSKLEAKLNERLEQVEQERLAEERKRLAAEEAKRQAEEEKRLAAEEAKRLAEEQQHIRDKEAERQAAEEQRLAAEEAKRLAELEERLKEAEAQRQAEEERRLAAEEAQRQAEEAKRLAAEDAKQREDAAKRLEETEAQWRADSEQRLKDAEAAWQKKEAKRLAELETKLKSEGEKRAAIEKARRKAEQELREQNEAEKKRLQRELEQAAENAKKALEAELKQARKDAKQEAELARQRAAEEAQRKADEAKQAAAEEAKRLADKEIEKALEEVRKEAEKEKQRAATEAERSAEAKLREAAEEARRMAEQERQRAAKEARKRAQMELRLAAQEARREAEEQLRRQAADKSSKAGGASQPESEKEARKKKALETFRRRRAIPGAMVSESQPDTGAAAQDADDNAKSAKTPSSLSEDSPKAPLPEAKGTLGDLERRLAKAASEKSKQTAAPDQPDKSSDDTDSGKASDRKPDAVAQTGEPAASEPTAAKSVPPQDPADTELKPERPADLDSSSAKASLEPKTTQQPTTGKPADKPNLRGTLSDLEKRLAEAAASKGQTATAVGKKARQKPPQGPVKTVRPDKPAAPTKPSADRERPSAEASSQPIAQSVQTSELDDQKILDALERRLAVSSAKGGAPKPRGKNTTAPLGAEQANAQTDGGRDTPVSKKPTATDEQLLLDGLRSQSGADATHGHDPVFSGLELPGKVQQSGETIRVRDFRDLIRVQELQSHLVAVLHRPEKLPGSGINRLPRPDLGDDVVEVNGFDRPVTDVSPAANGDEDIEMQINSFIVAVAEQERTVAESEAAQGPKRPDLIRLRTR